MAILRIQNKTNNYAIIDKRYLNNAGLSLKAKGLLTMLLGFPNDWEVRVKDIAQRSSDGIHATYAAFKELKEAGYIRHGRIRDEKGAYQQGQSGYYDVFETPQAQNEHSFLPQPENQDVALTHPQRENHHVDIRPHPENPHPDFPDVDFPHMENLTLLNTNCSKYKNNKTTNKHSEVKKNEERNPETTLLSPKPENFSIHLSNAPIGEILTDQQKQTISHFVFYELPTLQIAVSEPKQLHQEILYALQNPAYFSRAGTDFLKKFNAIKKCIREKKWRTPTGFFSSTTSCSATSPICSPAKEGYSEENMCTSLSTAIKQETTLFENDAVKSQQGSSIQTESHARAKINSSIKNIAEQLEQFGLPIPIRLRNTDDQQALAEISLYCQGNNQRLLHAFEHAKQHAKRDFGLKYILTILKNGAAKENRPNQNNVFSLSAKNPNLPVEINKDSATKTLKQKLDELIEKRTHSLSALALYKDVNVEYTQVHQNVVDRCTREIREIEGEIKKTQPLKSMATERRGVA
jgi:hypothetical protein